jgi:hypothetical protein
MQYGLDARGQSVDDAMPYDEYLELARRILVELRRVGIPRARLAINVPLDIRYGREPHFIASDCVGSQTPGVPIWRSRHASHRRASTEIGYQEAA